MTLSELAAVDQFCYEELSIYLDNGETLFELDYYPECSFLSREEEILSFYGDIQVKNVDAYEDGYRIKMIIILKSF